MIKKANEIQYCLECQLKELKERNSKIENYVYEVKKNIHTLVTDMDQKHKKQLSKMSDMNRQLENVNSMFKQKLAFTEEEFERAQQEFIYKEAQTEKYIQTLKCRVTAEQEWKKYYRQCHSTYEEEYIKMVESFKYVRAHYDHLKDELNKSAEEFFSSFPSKINEAESNVKEALSGITKFIYEKEKRKIKEYEELVNNHKELASNIKSLNKEVTKFNKKLIMNEEELEAYETSSLSLQKAQIHEVVLRSIEEQLQEQEELVKQLRNKLQRQDRDSERSTVKEFNYKGCKVLIRKAEVTDQYSEAIVCPTNETLGVFGKDSSLIREEAEEVLDQQCKDYIEQHGKLVEGKAVLFKAENLNNDYVILASIPHYLNDNDNHKRAKINMT